MNIIEMCYFMQRIGSEEGAGFAARLGHAFARRVAFGAPSLPLSGLFRRSVFVCTSSIVSTASPRTPGFFPVGKGGARFVRLNFHLHLYIIIDKDNLF